MLLVALHLNLLLYQFAIGSLFRLTLLFCSRFLQNRLPNTPPQKHPSPSPAFLLLLLFQKLERTSHAILMTRHLKFNRANCIASIYVRGPNRTVYKHISPPPIARIDYCFRAYFICWLIFHFVFAFAVTAVISATLIAHNASSRLTIMMGSFPLAVISFIMLPCNCGKETTIYRAWFWLKGLTMAKECHLDSEYIS